MAVLGVKLIADASAYKRALRQSEAATKRWARNVQQVGGAAGLGGGLFGLGKGGAAIAGAGAAALALKTVVSAASDDDVQIIGDLLHREVRGRLLLREGGPQARRRQRETEQSHHPD